MNFCRMPIGPSLSLASSGDMCVPQFGNGSVSLPSIASGTRMVPCTGGRPALPGGGETLPGHGVTFPGSGGSLPGGGGGNAAGGPSRVERTK